MITVSIVLYKNNPSELKIVLDCLTSSFIEKIYLVDNSPSNSLEKFCCSYSSKITYIYTQGNIGYGAAHNIAIKKSIHKKFKYHLVLNSDIYFDSNIIKELLDYMELNNDIGLIMPKIKYPDGKTQYLCKLLPTPFDLIGRRFIPFKKLVALINNKYELKFTGYEKIMQVPSLSGCFMLLRTEIIQHIGGFDERFFIYCEDFDLCRRIGQVSMTIYYPKVSVIHNYEKGSYKTLKLFFYHIRSAIKYFNKWGWFYDIERKKINNNTLNILNYKKKSK